MKIIFDEFTACEPIILDGEELVPRLELDLLAPTRHGFISTQLLPERGRPYVLTDEFEVHAHLRDFCAFARSDGVKQKTVSDYLDDLVVFERYLREVKQAKSLLNATSTDIGDYYSLVVDSKSAFRRSRSSWCRIEAALGRFYCWAFTEGLVRRIPKTRYRNKGTIAEITIKWISLDDYVLFRDVGLLGACPDGSMDPLFRGRSGLRNSAFAEYLITSGSRLTEAAVLLVGELPNSTSWAFRESKNTYFRYPEAITKGNVSRKVPFPRRVASTFIERYEREERSHQVERWKRSGAVFLRRDYIVGWRVPDGRIVLLHSDRRPRSLSSFSIDERRRLVLIASEQSDLTTAEPAALWLGEDGEMLETSAWESIFRRACQRLSDRFKITLHVTPHTLRHTFAVHWLSRLIARNARKLRQDWADIKDDRTLAVYQRITRNPLRVLQLWLGHRSAETTEKYLTFVEDALEAIEATTGEFDEILGASTVLGGVAMAA